MPRARPLPRPSAATVALAGSGLVVAAAGVWLLRTFDPNAPGNPFLPCLFQSTTGLLCPGCGVTRCLHALVHGDVMQALAMNPLIVGLLVLAPLTIAWRAGWQPAWLRPAARFIASPKAWIALLAIFWIARNLPWFPFTALAPG